MITHNSSLLVVVVVFSPAETKVIEFKNKDSFANVPVIMYNL